MVLGVIFKKFDLHSAAMALASMVLPVPGGPNKRTPDVVDFKMPVNRDGRRKGSAMTVCNVSLTRSKQAISRN